MSEAEPRHASAAEALNVLHTRTVDALAGCEKMVEKSEPDFMMVAKSLKDLHSRHAAQISAMVRDHGGTPDEDGSAMSTVNRVVVGLRALFDGIDGDVMEQVRDGEKWVIEAFDDAIAADPHADHSSQLAEMRSELTGFLSSPDRDS